MIFKTGTTGKRLEHKAGRNIYASTITMMFFVLVLTNCSKPDDNLQISGSGYLEKRGLNIFVFNSWYNSLFSDSKNGGIEIIHHEVRTVTNGDLRLSSTPEQWDPIPEFINRRIDTVNKAIEAFMKYPDYDFQYSVKVEVHDEGILLSVILEDPLPAELEGKTGFNLEFLPSAYFEKTYLIDGRSGTFPLYPGGPMKTDKAGLVQPKPVAEGKTLILAPEDPERYIKITTINNDLFLYDGRNKAQNGWFVVRSLVPPGETGKVIEWYLEANTIPGWVRKPVIAHSQAGYHPDQDKIAVVISLVHSFEAFAINRDETLIDQKKKYVDIHVPDGKPDMFRFGNTTGGPLEDEMLKAACELFVTTGDKKYEKYIIEFWPQIEKQFGRYVSYVLQVLPLINDSYTEKAEALVRQYKTRLDEFNKQNPFGVPVSRGGWAGSGSAIGYTITNYLLYKTYPDIIDKEYVFRGLNYIYGCHPGTDISFVSGVGTKSKKVAYGNNRADYSFIAGGVVPGVMILEPDFPENKEDWPFMWGGNEYVINASASYIFAVNAVNELLNGGL